MMKEIYMVLRDFCFLLIEVGIGIGKIFVYLFFSFYFVKRKEEFVIISI